MANGIFYKSLAHIFELALTGSEISTSKIVGLQKVGEDHGE